MRRYFSDQQGFTLVELMIGLTLTVILLTGIVGLLDSSLRSWRFGSGRTEMQQTARYAVDTMVREFKYGTNFQVLDAYTISYKEASTGNVYKYYLDTTSHILYRQAVTPAGTSYQVTGSNVQNSTNILINQQNQILFESPDSNTVKITLTAIDSITNQNISIQTAVYSQTKYLQ